MTPGKQTGSSPDRERRLHGSGNRPRCLKCFPGQVQFAILVECSCRISLKLSKKTGSRQLLLPARSCHGANGCERLKHVGSSAFGPRGADRCFHILFLFGRRQNRGHTEGFNPQLTSPTLCVIEVLVLLFLDLLVRCL